MMQALNFSGTFGSYGKRHCPSAAIDAANNCPRLSSITNEVGDRNKCFGRQNQKSKSNASKTMPAIFALVVFKIVLMCLNIPFLIANKSKYLLCFICILLYELVYHPYRFL